MIRKEWWKSTRHRRSLLGVCFLVLTPVVLFSSNAGAMMTRATTRGIATAEPLTEIFMSRSAEIVVHSTDVFVNSELTPVFARAVNGELILVGSVISQAIADSSRGVSLDRQLPHRPAYCRWRSQLWEPNGNAAELHRTPDSLMWVVQALVPPEKQRWLTRRIAEGMIQFRDELGAELEPLLIESATDMMPFVQERLIIAIRNHQPQIEELSLKYRDTLVRDRVLPLLQEEVYPIVQRRASPLLMRIGEEMFERASLWRFTWRLLYDASPLPRRNLVQSEFDRFFRTEGIPILSAHSMELLNLGKEIAKDLLANPRIREVSRDAATELFQDPQLRALITDCVAEAFEDPTPIRDAIRQRWATGRYQDFLQRLEQLFEPIMREIGHELLGSKESGLTDELVTVLRAQILSKDKEWIVVPCRPRIEHGTLPKTIRLVPADAPSTFPLMLTGKQ